MPRLLIVALLVFCSFGASAQIATPEKQKFNAGAYVGLSIWKYKPMVAVDLSYKGTTLRLMPNYNYYSVGLTQEILKLSPVFYNLLWTVSAYGGYGTEAIGFSADPSKDYTRVTNTAVLNTGLKTYFSKRMYTNVMAGVMYTKTTPVGLDDENTWNPYFEFGIGMNIFKNYPKLKPEETNE